jgi:hypothetical protein
MVQAPSSEVGEQWEAALRATQDLGMPCPRLQFTWVLQGEQEDMYNTVCLYTLVLPLRDSDIRCEGEEGAKVRREWHALIGATRIGGNTPLIHGNRVDTPFRDGAHANWDAEKLGLQVWAVCDRTTSRIERD